MMFPGICTHQLQERKGIFHTMSPVRLNVILKHALSWSLQKEAPSSPWARLESKERWLTYTQIAAKQEDSERENNMPQQSTYSISVVKHKRHKCGNSKCRIQTLPSWHCNSVIQNKWFIVFLVKMKALTCIGLPNSSPNSGSFSVVN